MDLVDAIRHRGFRKWYERQLVESHLYLVTCVLCMILVAACVEAFSFRAPGLQPLFMLALIGGGGAVGLLAWHRYRSIMTVAEHYGDHSTCSACGTYGRFDILDWGEVEPAALGAGAPAAGAHTWLKVRCRKCGHLWTMD